MRARKPKNNIFAGLVRHYRLSGVQVEGTGLDPKTLVRKAKEMRQREKRQGDPYDQVYCVFDRDEHPLFDQASDQAMQSRLELVRSWPCFEYWFLLHFRYTRHAFVRAGDRSPCEKCTAALRARNCCPAYEKGCTAVFELLQDRLEIALVRATQAAQAATLEDDPNPSTEVHRLVQYLQSLAKVTPS